MGQCSSETSSAQLRAVLSAFVSTLLSLIICYSPFSYAAAYQSSTTSAIELATAGAGAAADTSNLANIAAFSYPSIAMAARLLNLKKTLTGSIIPMALPQI